MSKMEVKVTNKDGEVEWFNPVDEIVISVKDGYDYNLDPTIITSLEVYPMKEEDDE